MLAIAIDSNKFLVYEGDGHHGHALWPAPVLSVATVLVDAGDATHIPAHGALDYADMIFREDSFDPVTRIRRGRLYQTPGARPADWLVQGHPAYRSEDQFQVPHGYWLPKKLFSFHSWTATSEVKAKLASTLVALGTSEAYTIWRLIDIERIITGEDLITLRARIALGTLPEINMAAIPDEGRAKVIETLDKLANAAHRAGPESVVDAARAAAQWCIGVFLSEKSGDPAIRHKDLGELGKALEDRTISKSLTQILARMHSRAKPNEQDKYETRPLREDDADFALAAIGMLLRELKWTI